MKEVFHRSLSLMAVLTLLISTGLLAAPSTAAPVFHRDGCHRWHTCPSDDGSYVCGDLGYPCGSAGPEDPNASTPTTPPSAPASAPAAAPAAQGGFADPAFQKTWERTDKPVADGKANRSWYWGPTPGVASTEPYKDAPGGSRRVQYFDKTRMEINNPNGDKNSAFYVTNGLLATELMTGRMQVGDNDFEQRCAADIPLASDNDDASAPTYATFGTLMGAAKANKTGQKATATTDKAGNVGNDASKATVAGVDLVYYDQITQRNVPKVFWDFLNAQGPVYTNGQYTNAQLNQPWFFASGLPTTEAYWAKVKIAGQQLDVLIQGFERRVLTYIPAYNGTPFNVQMGNVGQHYYDWRYKNAGCSSGPAPTQPPTQPTSVPATPAPTQATGPDCSGIPAPRNGTITPNCGPAGTQFRVTGTGFTPNERISFWITAPDGSVVGTARPLNLGSHGAAVDFGSFDSAGIDPGVWAFTFQGEQSGNQTITWFKITGGSAGPAPTQPPASDCDLTGTKDGSVSPTSGPAGTEFDIEVHGFQGGETVSYWLTDGSGRVYGSPQTFVMPGSGSDQFTFDSTGVPTGRWAVTFHGLTSNHESIVYFCIK